MATKSHKIREELKRDLDELRGLRDEIVLKVHLAGMDAKSAWEELEPRLEKLEKELESEGETIVESGLVLAKDLRRAFIEFRDRL
jgi:hypothetical protein